MHARTYGIVARDAPVAVVFRRGPTRHLRLLRWNLTDDTVTAGQWLVGSVNPGTSGLSPDGELLVYEERIKGHRAITAVSRPPYFSALAHWSYSAPWSGGGFFADAHTLVLGMSLGEPEGDLPPGLTVTDAWSWFGMNERHGGFGDAVRAEPCAHHGWIFERDVERKVQLSQQLARRTRSGARDYALADERRRTLEDLGALDWADFAPDGTLVFGRDGCLFHRRDGEARLVADLHGQVFEPMAPPPEAMQWPTYLTRRGGR